MSTSLSVNLNKIAWLRNARQGDNPNLLEFMEVCIAAGCHGITVHPRPDQRHIRPADVSALHHVLATAHPHIEYNLEGNPFEGPTKEGYPGFLELVEANRPAQATLVPDAPGQLTSDHGWTFSRQNLDRLAPVVERLKGWGVRVSVFVDPGAQGLEHLPGLGIDRVELYTGPYAQAWLEGDMEAVSDVLVSYAETAAEARALGLGVNAGHDLDQLNLSLLLEQAGPIDEVSIGHALVVDALRDGMGPTVERYVALVERLPDSGA